MSVIRADYVHHNFLLSDNIFYYFWYILSDRMRTAEFCIKLCRIYMRCYVFIKAVMVVFATKLHYSKISRRVLVVTNISEELGASILKVAKDVVYLVGLSCL